MFLSQYCIKFRRLDPVQQQNIIVVNNNINNKEKDDNDNNDDDGDGDDITVPPIQYHDIARAGTFH